MSKKEQIITNIRDYSAADIARAIQSGELSLYELSKSGVLTPLMKKHIEEQLACMGDNDSQDDSRESKTEPLETDSELNSESAATTAQDETEISVSTKEDTPIPIYPSETIVAPIPAEEEHSSIIKQLFSFKGRMRRLHYFLCIIAFYALIFLSVVFMIELSKDSIILGLLGGVIMFFSVWFIFAARVKRCHDRGNSGWWLLYTAIPYIGVLFSITLLFGKGDDEENEYGLNPRN